MVSKFTEDEIIGFTEIDGRKVTVLKMGVKRKRFNDSIDPNTLEGHINENLIAMQKWEWYNKVIIGEDDFEN